MRPVLTLLVLLAATSMFAQDTYTVIKVAGKVLSMRLNRPLVTGDKVQEKDALKFGSKSDYVILQSPKSSRKVVKGVPDSSPREFIQLLQSFVKPAAKSTASRGGGQGYIEKLSQKLSSDTLVILGDGKIRIEKDQLRLDKPAGIRVIYSDGKSSVVRTLSDAGSFSLSRMSLFGGEPPQPVPRVTIQYFENESEDFAFAAGAILGNFVPRYLDETQLRKEIVTLLSLFEGTKHSQAELVDEIEDYLEMTYWAPVRENLNDWLFLNKLIK
jgi:hypothetical protein